MIITTKNRRAKEVNLARRRTRMLYICWLFERTLTELGWYAIWAIADSWASESVWTLAGFGWQDYLLVSWLCSWVTDDWPWLNWGDKAVFTQSSPFVSRGPFNGISSRGVVLSYGKWNLTLRRGRTVVDLMSLAKVSKVKIVVCVKIFQSFLINTRRYYCHIGKIWNYFGNVYGIRKVFVVNILI